MCNDQEVDQEAAPEVTQEVFQVEIFVENTTEEDQQV